MQSVPITTNVASTNRTPRGVLNTILCDKVCIHFYLWNNLKMFLLCKYYTIQQLFSSSCFACRSFGPPRLKICQSYWKFIGPVFLLTLFIVSQQCCLQNLLVLIPSSVLLVLNHHKIVRVQQFNMYWQSQCPSGISLHFEILLIGNICFWSIKR
jgi:hypothetical protein